MKIEFADRSVALAWVEKSVELNQKSSIEVKETMKLVEEINQESQGSLVDELVHGANQVINFVERVTSTAEEISGVMRDVTNKVADVVDNVAGAIGGIFKIFG